jgi:hypothetical protein
VPVGQDEAAAAPGAPAEESAPEFPPQRGPETAVPHRVPPQRPDADEQPGRPGAPQAPAEGGAGTASGAAGLGAEAGQAPERPQPPEQASGGLGARERGVLDFERRRWKHVGAKEQAIRDTFDVSPTHYYQILNALLDDPGALAYSPALVNRLRRAREAKRRERR